MTALWQLSCSSVIQIGFLHIITDDAITCDDDDDDGTAKKIDLMVIAILLLMLSMLGKEQIKPASVVRMHV